DLGVAVGVGVVDEDPRIVRKPRMERHAEESALAAARDPVADVEERRRQDPSVADDPDPAALLRHEQPSAAVPGIRDPERCAQPVDERLERDRDARRIEGGAAGPGWTRRLARGFTWSGGSSGPGATGHERDQDRRCADDQRDEDQTQGRPARPRRGRAGGREHRSIVRSGPSGGSRRWYIRPMDAFELADLAARREASGAPYLEFLSVPDLSVGLYVLAAGQPDLQQPHTE